MTKKKLTPKQIAYESNLKKAMKDVESGKLARYSDSSLEYERFITVMGNRKLSENNVNRLVNSIEKEGNLTSIVCRFLEKDGNIHFEIMDGQHRFEALKILEKPIIFDCFKMKNKGMIALNENQSNWVLQDYLNYGVEDGIEDYKFIADLQKETGLALAGLIDLFRDFETTTSGGQTKQSEYSATAKQNKYQVFRNLRFRIINKEKGLKIVDMILQFYHEFNINFANTLRFIESFRIIAMNPRYDHERMIFQLSKGQKITKCVTITDYVKNFEDIYNYGKSHANRVIFMHRFHE